MELVRNEKHLEDRVFESAPSEQRVLLWPDGKLEKTKSGIYIPETAEEDKPRVCTVVRVGKGSADNPMMYKPGEKVLLSKFAGTEVKFNLKGIGYEQFVVTNQIDIMMKLEEEEV